jgi:hypothetical protein
VSLIFKVGPSYCYAAIARIDIFPNLIK